MWSYRIVAPYQFEKTSIPEKTPDSSATARCCCGSWPPGSAAATCRPFAVCAADFRVTTAAAAPKRTAIRSTKSSGRSSPAAIRSTGPVIGWWVGRRRSTGLMERVVTDGDQVAPYDPALTPAQAIGLQPLACVLYAVEQLPDLDGRHVGIIGQGSIGLLFSCAAKAAGARHVTGVDPVDRAEHRRKVRRRHLRAGHQRPVGQSAGSRGPAGHRDRSRRPSGRDPQPRDRGHRSRWHRLLLRRRRRRQLSDQHAHHAAQQPDTEIRCDA